MDKSKQMEKQTLVEEGTELKGTLRSTCQVVVNGSIDGQIEAPSLTITSTGTVLGSVRAMKLRSEGTLAGDIDAEDVYLAGTVRSNTMIRAKKLEVKLAPERGKLEVTFGECLIEVGEDPAHVEEPVADRAALVETLAVAPPAAEAPAASREEEPTWSEPPPLQASDAAVLAGEPPVTSSSSSEENPTGEMPAVAAAQEIKESPELPNGGRRRKNSDRRDSQAPPS